MAFQAKPILTDETGEEIVSALDELIEVLKEYYLEKEYTPDPPTPEPPIDDTIVYGFHVDSTNSDPKGCIEYLEDCTNYTPAEMDYTNDTFNYGSWLTTEFFMPKPCMVKYDGTVDYYLDPNDYTKKIDGSDSDLIDLQHAIKYQGNAMMEWGRDGNKIWIKVVPDNNDNTSGSVYISNKQVDDGYTAYSFINNQGIYVDHFYTAIYNGSITAYKINNTTYYRLRSIPYRITMNSPGNNNYNKPYDDIDIDYDPANPNTYDNSELANTDANTEIAYSQNNNININSNTIIDQELNRSNILWNTEVLCDIQLINILLILLGKSLNTQDIYGKGNMIGDAIYIINNGVLYTGSSSYDSNNIPVYDMYNKGLFWGSNTDINCIKVFGMENWWGNQYRRYNGHINNLGKQYIKLTFGTNDGSSVIGYNTDGNGYIDTGISVNTNITGFIKQEVFNNNTNTILPNGIVGGSSSTYYSDYIWYYNDNIYYACRSNGSDFAAQELEGGIFFIDFNLQFSQTAYGISTSLSLKI